MTGKRVHTRTVARRALAVAVGLGAAAYAGPPWDCTIINPCCKTTCGSCEACSGGACQHITCCDVYCGDCKTCLNDACVQTDPCCGVHCGECQHCDGNGNCVQSDPCCGVHCPTCQSCENGVCVQDNDCCGVNCPECKSCKNGSCVQNDPCCGVECGQCEVCDEGSCVRTNPCCGVNCPSCQSCQNGACVTDNECCDVNCPACQRCSGGACINDCQSGQTCCGGTCCDGTCCNGTCCPAGSACCGSMCSCDDENPCTDDACENGACEHTPKDCDDHNGCTDDSCVDGQCENTERSCGSCELCDRALCDALGVCCSPQCACSSESEPARGMFVPEQECAPCTKPAPHDPDAPGSCNVSVQCYREDSLAPVNLGDETTVGGTLCCESCDGNCPESSPPPVTCESQYSNCVTAQVTMSISPSVTFNIGNVELALSGGLGFTNGEQVCLGSGCSVTPPSCTWATLDHHLNVVTGKEVKVVHTWRWYDVRQTVPGLCGCDVLNTTCPQTAESTAVGTGPVGSAVCGVKQSGGCAPDDPCTP